MKITVGEKSYDISRCKVSAVDTPEISDFTVDNTVTSLMRLPGKKYVLHRRTFWVQPDEVELITIGEAKQHFNNMQDKRTSYKDAFE